MVSSIPSNLPAPGDPAPHSDPRIEAIWKAIETVSDPEIPVLNVVDMGIIASVRTDDRRVTVNVTPTFVGCPAVEVIRENIRLAVMGIGEQEVAVNLVFDPPWTSDRMTERGRRNLREFGLAPPIRGLVQIGLAPPEVVCPFCQSSQTEAESMFGPTLCRAIYYCHSCLQSFEHFKNV